MAKCTTAYKEKSAFLLELLKKENARYAMPIMAEFPMILKQAVLDPNGQGTTGRLYSGL